MGRGPNVEWRAIYDSQIANSCQKFTICASPLPGFSNRNEFSVYYLRYAETCCENKSGCCEQTVMFMNVNMRIHSAECKEIIWAKFW